MRRDDGPAFPHTSVQDVDKRAGMSMRDWFAGQALVPAYHEFARKMGEGDISHFEWDLVAVVAYQIADAMLVARRLS